MASVQEDMRTHVGSLVPKFIALFQDAERSGNYSVMDSALSVRTPCLAAVLPVPLLLCPLNFGVLVMIFKFACGLEGALWLVCPDRGAAKLQHLWRRY